MNRKVSHQQYNNSWYKKEIGASKFRQWAWFVVNVVFFLNPINSSSSLKRGLLRLFGAKIGTGVVIKPSINIKYPWKLSIGDYSWVGEKVWIDNLAQVDIGQNVCLSQGCLLLTGNHDYNKTSFDLIVRMIVLEDGVWIGANATVCPGVTCLSHSVLSAGSVATQSLDRFKIYQGNPASCVRDRIIEE